MNIPRFTVKLISTFFFVGYSPILPGTTASLVAICIYYFVKGSIFYLLFTLISIIAGFYLSGRAEEIFKKKDAECIVIDEVAGVFLSFIFIPYNPKLLIIGFILFRILDGIKPYPADKLQRLEGSIGIMSDDIVAGLYTNIILQLILRLSSFIAS